VVAPHEEVAVEPAAASQEITPVEPDEPHPTAIADVEPAAAAPVEMHDMAASGAGVKEEITILPAMDQILAEKSEAKTEAATSVPPELAPIPTAASSSSRRAVIAIVASGAFVGLTLLIILSIWGSGAMLPFTAPAAMFISRSGFEFVDSYGASTVLPNGTSTFGLTVKNTGSTRWAPNALTARFYSVSGMWPEATASVGTSVGPGETGHLLVTARGISTLGVYTDLKWDVSLTHLGVTQRVR
jgi:hypothetical protein